MSRGPTQKRQALGKASLPDPQNLLRAPAAGLQVGQIQKQARVRKNAWVWEQFELEQKKDFINWLNTVCGVEEEEQALAAQAAAENARLAAGNAQLAAGNAQLAAEDHEEREAMIGFDD